MNKKILVVIFLMVLSLNLWACGNKDAEKYCSSCGKGIQKESSFCEHCGNPTSNDKKEDKQETNKDATINSDENVEGNTQNTNNDNVSNSKDTTSTKPNKVQTHTHAYSKSVKSATCSEQGYTTYKCTCGHSYTDNYVKPSHEFSSSYICTKCGVVDKSHAYEYLIELVKLRGTAFSEVIKFDIYGDGVTYLAYDASENYLYIYLNMPSNNGSNLFCSLSLDSFSYFTKLDDIEVFGYLDAKNHTANSPLSIKRYSGPTNQKHLSIELTRQAMTAFIESLKTVLEESTDGQLTIADIGFKSY